MEEITFADIDFSDFIFKANHVEEELDDIDIDGIGNIEDLPRLLFINKECGSRNLVVNDGEHSRNIN